MAWTVPLPTGGHRGMWRDANGRRRSASYDKTTGKHFTGPRGERTALDYAIGQEAIARNDGPQNDGRGLTWTQWSQRWLELRRVEPTTKKADQGRIAKYLEPRWGTHKITRITRTQVQAWVNDLADTPGLSAATVARIYHLFSASMKAAVKAGQLSANPCALIDIPTVAPAKERYLTKAEVDSLIAKIDDPTSSDLILFLAYTGLRLGEAIGLHWNRVDLSNSTVTVIETWDRPANKIKPYPKSKRGRTVPLTERLQVMLANQPADVGTCGEEHTDGRPCTSGLVFPSATGGAIDYANLRNRQWIPAFELKEKNEPILEPARLHDLRHSYASWLAQDGVPLHVIRELLGHATITTTERYSHFGAEQYDRVRDALGG